MSRLIDHFEVLLELRRSPARLVPLAAAAIVASGCGSQPAPTAAVPVAPSNPTHHAVVEGAAQFAAAWGSDTLIVGAGYDSTAAPALRLNVVGGAAAERTGQYRVRLYTDAPSQTGGVGVVELHFVRLRPDRSQRMVATRSLTLRVAPLDSAAPVTRAPSITLPE